MTIDVNPTLDELIAELQSDTISDKLRIFAEYAEGIKAVLDKAAEAMDEVSVVTKKLGDLWDELKDEPPFYRRSY